MKKSEYIQNYYFNLCQRLNEHIILLEKKIKAKKEELKKKKKMDPVGEEDADIDNDGKPNTKVDQYLANRREAIKSSMNRKKKNLKEGTIVGNDMMHYGGFPRILKENNGGVVNAFNDADDRPGKPRVATLSDDQEETLAAMERRYAEMIAANKSIEGDYDEPGERRGLGQLAREQLYGPANALRAKIEAHPEFIARREAAMPNQFPPPFIRTPETEERKMGRRIG